MSGSNAARDSLRVPVQLRRGNTDAQIGETLSEILQTEGTLKELKELKDKSEDGTLDVEKERELTELTNRLNELNDKFEEE